MDPITPILVPQRALHNSPTSSAHWYHTQSFWRQTILHSRISRYKPSIWSSLASRPTPKNKTNLTPTIFRPPAFLFTTPLPCGLLQQRQHSSSHDALLRGSTGEHPGLFLYTLYTADIPQTSTTILSTFADDTAIMATHSTPTTASMNIQAHLSKIEHWARKWRLKINETKFAHITFTLRKETCLPVHINQAIISDRNSQISWPPFWQTSHLERICNKNKDTLRPQIPRIDLAHW
jgi:hypothetical protein